MDSTAHSDRREAVLVVLGDYFSRPIAELLVTTTLQRISIIPEEAAQVGTSQLIEALVEALPAFLGDPRRREDCVRRLCDLTESAQGRTEGSTVVRLRSLHPSASASSPAPGERYTYAVATADDVGNSCEAVRALAERIGFPQVTQTKIATAVAELARNMQLYARGGRLKVSTIGTPPRGIEVIASDDGPGIADLDLVLSGRYKSRTGMGMGLRGARRLVDTFQVSSSPAGTRVVLRKFLT